MKVLRWTEHSFSKVSGYFVLCFLFRLNEVGFGYDFRDFAVGLRVTTTSKANRFRPTLWLGFIRFWIDFDTTNHFKGF